MSSSSTVERRLDGWRPAVSDYTDLLGAILLALAVVAGGWLWVVLIGSLV